MKTEVQIASYMLIYVHDTSAGAKQGQRKEGPGSSPDFGMLSVITGGILIAGCEMRIGIQA
jgi:hypothetical protein